MNTREFFKKSIAWLLITTMVNPAMIAPVFARDSDIYLATTSGTATAEPNVLFILGTNDRMNIAEPWREYDPNTYDSHVEYLWNDSNIIGTTEVVAESQSAISDAAPPVNPASPWGTWDGALYANRLALWQATLAYSQGTQAGDPGKRNVYRNYYNDFSWLYWLPAGTATTDPRLRSVSFNRFRAGPTNYLASTRGGVTFPPTNPTSPYDYRTVNSSFAQFNLCNSSLAQLTPSTVMAPTSTAQNTGIMLNTQWVRFDPWLNTATVGNSGYPGSSTVTSTYSRGYLDASVAPVNGFPVTPTTAPSTSGAPFRDSEGSSSKGSQGQPIRIQLDVAPVGGNYTAGDSYAGWDDVKADLGGYAFQSAVINGLGANGFPYSCALTGTGCTTAGTYAVLQSVLATYGISTQIGASWPFTAWRGNRDSTTPAPAFGSVTGTHGYFDGSGACDPATGPASSFCINIPGAGTPGQDATWTQNCTFGAGTSETDASNTARFRNGTCTAAGAPTCVDPRCPGGPGTCVGVASPCADFAAPACTKNTQNQFLQKFFTAACTASGQSQVVVNTCTWQNRQTVYVEGNPQPSTTAGVFYFGGTCAENGSGVYSTTNCQISGTRTQILNGVFQPNVVGGFTLATAASHANDGCSNKTTPAAGTYRYGGTCGGGTQFKVNATVPAGARTANSPLDCGFTGGTGTLTIQGQTQNFNQNCVSTNLDQTCSARYGAACDAGNTAGSTCPTRTSTKTNAIAATPGTNNFYQTFPQVNRRPNFFHECLGDISNPGNGFPTQHPRNFNTNANTVPALVSVDTTATFTEPYTTNPAQSVVADSTKNIDVYSVNYLNFLYGAKACRDSSGNLITTSPVDTPPAGAVCSPLGRKTRLQVAKDAISSLVTVTDGVRLGLMVLNKSDASGSSQGGNIAYAIRRMGDNAADTPAFNNRAALVTAIQNITASSRTPLTETMYEAYRYFSGRTPTFGTLGTLTPASPGPAVAVSTGRETSLGTNSDTPANTVFLTNATGRYNSPMLNNPNVAGPANCQKNYVVMITNGQPEDDFAANALIKTMVYGPPGAGPTVAARTDFDAAGGTPPTTTFNQIPTISGGNPHGPIDLGSTANDGGYIWLDELAYFMSHADISPGAANFQSEYSSCSSPQTAPGHPCSGPTTTDLISGTQPVVTYTIGFAGVNSPVVQNAAVVSGGVYYVAQNAQQLQAALLAAFVAIRNFNPTAAAATVPISSLNRGESSHDVYLAFFGPSSASVWPGTVKKYQISVDPLDCGPFAPLCLTGQNQINGFYNIEKLDPITGQFFVDPTATSGPNDLNHPPGSAWYPSTVQDGPLPTRGGTGHVLINTAGYTPDQRKIYTYLTDSVTNQTAGTKSSTTDLTHPSNTVDYVSGNSRVTRCRLGDAGACAGSATMSFPTKETLISYIRGGNLGDTACTDGDPNTNCTTFSTWPHGGVEHSKPVIVDYDISNPLAPVQYMYYLQNNGMLTAVDTRTGLEKWSFLIEEALPQLQALQANANGPEIYVADGSPAVFYEDKVAPFGTITPGGGPTGDRVWIYFGLRRGGRVMYALDITDKDRPKFMWKITAQQPVLVTGNITAGSSTLNVGSTGNFAVPAAVGSSIRVVGAGAGGSDLITTISSYTATTITLAVNASTSVTNTRVESIGAPIVPARICNNTSTCAAEPKYSEMGQTWSTPAVVQLKNLFGAPNSPPALIFGGGYDPAEDTIPPGTRTMGRAVYIVNGFDASIIKSFGAGQANTAADYRTAGQLGTFAVPSDITAINTDFDSSNFIDRLVFGDLGGNVWRIDVDDPLTSNWQAIQIASLSNAVGEKRKFFYPPAVAPQDKPYRFDAIYIGSGDKEHPLATSNTVPATTTDLMFMLMDDPSLNSGGGTPNGPNSPSGIPLTTPILVTSSNLVDIDAREVSQAALPPASRTPLDLTNKQGWLRRLENGEKVVNAPTVFKLDSQVSRLRFGTYAPLATNLGLCTPPGNGRLNEIDALNGGILLTSATTGLPSRYYTGFLSRGYVSSTQLLILPSGGAGSPKNIYQFNCADANCQGTLIGTLGAPTKIYWYLEPEQ